MGLLKKKKKDEPSEPIEQVQGKDGGDPKAVQAKPKKKGLFKKLIILLLILGILGGGGFFVYTKFLSSDNQNDLGYQPGTLTHVSLPGEILAFCFARMPDLYDALVAFNGEMDLFEAEIARIDAVATKYPDQKKIADGQKKIWEKGRDSLKKTFEKLEKPIKETFVLFQVNQAAGQEKIDETAEQMILDAGDALKKAQEQTAPLKNAMPKAPEGMVKGTLYKIKKMFL
ncbi:MAG: hypothetical protein AB7U43_06980 [Desulfobacter sp.]